MQSRCCHHAKGRLYWFIQTLIALSFCSIAGTAAEWHEEKDFRWSALEVPPNGKVGVRQLPPEKTGIFFTNALDDWSAAANRVLENGSGTAIGDMDGDGKPDIFLCGLQGHSALYKNL